MKYIHFSFISFSGIFLSKTTTLAAEILAGSNAYLAIFGGVKLKWRSSLFNFLMVHRSNIWYFFYY